MDIVRRARNILLQPKAEWPVIAAEPTTTAALYTGYLIPLALVGAVARFIGLALIGISVPFLGTVRVPIGSALASTVTSLVLSLVGMYVWAMIINALAPTFGGQRDMNAALRLAVYSLTPALVAGILGILPSLMLLQLVAACYALYLLYLGFPVLMRSAPERSGTYTAATVVAGMVLGLVFAAVSTAFNLSPLGARGRMASDADAQKMGANMVAGMLGAAGGNSPDSKQAAAALVAGAIAAGNKAAAAGADGATPATTASNAETDPQAAMGAAAAMLGAMAGGGKAHVEPVDFHVLKDLMPASAGGLARTNAEGEKASVGGFAASNAQGSYADGNGNSLTIKISDLANASALLAMGRMGFSVERESDSGFEKNVTLAGQRVHEKWNPLGKSGELVAIVGDRYLVEISGQGVDVRAAEQAFASLDLGKLPGGR